MIFLDPDIEAEPARAVTRGTSSRVRSEQKAGQPGRVPSVRVLARFLATAKAAVRLRGEVSVLFTTDRAIRKLNRQFREKNKATDVLSFPAAGPAAAGMAGDLAISVPTARRQAAEQGHTLAVELKVLLLHGLLHLAGYDHETDTGQMARRERSLRAKLGLPQGLIERVEGRQTSQRPRRSAGARP